MYFHLNLNIKSNIDLAHTHFGSSKHDLSENTRSKVQFLSIYNTIFIFKFVFRINK